MFKLAVIAAVLAAVQVAADTCSATYGGSCQDVSGCNSGTVTGICPGAANIKCCLPRCTSGQCINTATTSCSGTLATGLCPGPAGIKCCQDQCAGTYGGTCKDTSQCNSGEKAGICPGSSTNKCCLPTCTGGQCIDTTAETCSGGTLATGLCPGPTAIKCCQQTSGGTSGGGTSGASSCTYPCATAAGNTRSLGSNGLDLITAFEGFSSTCYRDSNGILTIGYGHACQDSSDDLPQYGVVCHANACSGSLTQAEARSVLNSDASSFVACVRSAVGSIPLTQNQFDALVSFAFNVGCGSLNSSTLLAQLKAHTLTDQAAQYQLSRWNSGCLEGLKRRRFTESQLFSSCATTFGCSASGCAPGNNYKGCSGNCQYCSACGGCTSNTYSISGCKN